MVLDLVRFSPRYVALSLRRIAGLSVHLALVSARNGVCEAFSDRNVEPVL